MRTESMWTPTATARSWSPASTSSSDNPVAVTDRELEIEFLDGGAQAFCFTFG